MLMEPAFYGREYLSATPPYSSARHAAMKPARKRREHGSRISGRLTWENTRPCEVIPALISRR